LQIFNLIALDDDRDDKVIATLGRVVKIEQDKDDHLWKAFTFIGTDTNGFHSRMMEMHSLLLSFQVLDFEEIRSNLIDSLCRGQKEVKDNQSESVQMQQRLFEHSITFVESQLVLL